MSEPAPRRLTLADAYRDSQHVIDKLTDRGNEPAATVEIDTTAKGDPKPRVHLYAPLDADLDALKVHAKNLSAIALEAYFDATPANGVAVPSEDNPF